MSCQGAGLRCFSEGLGFKNIESETRTTFASRAFRVSERGVGGEGLKTCGSMTIRRYTTESASHPGQQHELVVVSGRVSPRTSKGFSAKLPHRCTCPGWGFRHECRHAARLGAFLAEFQADASKTNKNTGVALSS